jgi:predicted permease
MRWIYKLPLRFRSVFRKTRVDRDLTEELHFHFAALVEANVRKGMTAAEARFAALRELGPLEQLKEECRDSRKVNLIETLVQDLRFGLRQLRRNPGFTAVTVITLALGIGATTAIFSVVKAVLLAPLPYKAPGRIVAVWTTNPAQGGDPGPSTPGDFEIWRQRSGAFQGLAPSYDSELTLTGVGSPQYLIGYAVSAGYLRILGVNPRLGRVYTDREDAPGGPHVALLSDRLWRTTFQSDPGIVGRAITLDGASYTVLGVMPSDFDYPPATEIWVPAALAPSAFNDFDHSYIRILGRLRDGVSIAQARKTLNALEARIAVAHPATNGGNRVALVPLREQLAGDIREPLLILMGAVGLVMLIACANTAGLALARDAERQKEIAVRLALGATRRRLLRQFLTESFLLAAIGGAAGIAIALAGTRFLLAMFPNDVANLSIPKVTDIPMDAGVFAFAIATTLLTAVLVGAAPVLRAVGVRPEAAINESGRGSTANRRSTRSRSAMVVGEIALALMLLSAAGLLVASFRNVMNSRLGFQPDHVLSLQVLLPPDRYPETNGPKRIRFVEDVVTRLRALPGVSSAAATNFLPLSGFWGTVGFLRSGAAPPKNGRAPEADNRLITPEYLRTMGIPLLRGRSFSPADRAGALHVALINLTFARKYFAGRDPIGESLNLGSAAAPDWWRIVGVVGDVKAFGRDQPTHADIYRPFAQHTRFRLVAFTLRAQTDPNSLIRVAEAALWSVDPNQPVLKAIPLSVLAGQTLSVRRASSALISAFALLALLLACIGIYGVMAYAVVQRTQEIGVRMALGARQLDVLRLIMGTGARLTLVGIVIGLAGTLACARLLAAVLFDVSAVNPLIFSLSVAVLAAVSLAASWLPAHAASSLDPVQALRTQ